ncbi:sri-63, partial [Pristionchus pacificus]
QIDDAFITFMLYYMHVVSGVTLILSAVVFYLMLTRTPRSGRALVKHLMVVQVFVTLNDIILCVLLCGIPLFPLPAGFCEGVLCAMGIPGHVGLVLMYFALAYVAASIVMCFQAKHRAVVELAKHRPISPIIFPIFLFASLSTPCIIFIFGYTAIEDGPKYIAQTFPDYIWIFSTNRVVISYSFNANLPLVVAIILSVALGMALVVFLCAFFIGHTFHLLSRHALLFSSRTRLLQRKLLINLITQMSIPFTVQIGPFTYYGLVVITGVSTLKVTNVIFCIQLLHAPLHSLLIIATTPSYREAILRISPRRSEFTGSKTVQSVAISTVTSSQFFMEEIRQIEDAFFTFMLYYMHIASGITLLASSIVFYLMLTRTPQTGKALVEHLMAVQFFITFNDLVLCVLFCCIPLFPLPAGFCEGVLCAMGISPHVGLVLLCFSLGYVAASIVLCFYAKHRAVVELTK